MEHILTGCTSSCVDYLRMCKGSFFNLTRLMKESELLRDTIHVPIEEQLAMFLCIVGHKTKNRIMGVDFIRSGEWLATISMVF